MNNRSVVRHTRWRLRLLTAREAHPPVYSAVCGACHDASVGYSTPGHAERWALQHAAKHNNNTRKHRQFRMVTESWAIAEPFTPAP